MDKNTERLRAAAPHTHYESLLVWAADRIDLMRDVLEVIQLDDGTIGGCDLTPAIRDRISEALRD